LTLPSAAETVLL